MAVEVADARDMAEARLARAPEGDGLAPVTAALIALGLAACATTLDVPGVRHHTAAALDLGATPDQVTEMVVLVSAVGVHALHEGARQVADELRDRHYARVTEPLDPEQQALVDRYVGDDGYWVRLERELPGFLDALVRLSPPAFEAFFVFTAVPWRTRHLDPLTKELAYLALDATPTHRYGPGLRLHVDNALRLGATATQVREALDLAADAGHHAGVA